MSQECVGLPWRATDLLRKVLRRSSAYSVDMPAVGTPFSMCSPASSNWDVCSRPHRRRSRGARSRYRRMPTPGGRMKLFTTTFEIVLTMP